MSKRLFSVPGTCLPLVLLALSVRPATAQTLSSVSLSPTSVTGGTNSTGTVTLSANAPSGGKVVSLSSGNTGAATVPATVTVASGTKTKTFTVTTAPQPNDATAVITAVLSGVTKTATLTVKAPVMSAASVAPTSVTGGAGTTFTVTLTGNAPSAGKAVALTSSNTQAASLPASVTVAAGAASASAPVTTSGVDSNATVTLTGTAGGVAKTASLTVSKPALSNVSVSPTTIPGSGTATGAVTLTGPAGPSKVTVTLSSSNTSVATVPASVQVAAGQTTATFTVTGTSLPAGGTSTITATFSGVNKTASITLQPSAALQSVSLSASSVLGGGQVSGTVLLTAAAPAGGTSVTLSSSQPSYASVSASVTVSQGQTSAGFSVTTIPVGSLTAVTITASRSGVNKTAPLNVRAAALAALSISPQSIPGGTTATGTLTLEGPSGPAGAMVSLASSSTDVATVPSSTVIAAGQSSGTFTITGASVTSDSVTTITATLGSGSVHSDVTVTRTIGALSGAVRDADTGFALPSARVELADDPALQTWTDPDGHYELVDVPAGAHAVVVSLERYSPVTSASVNVSNGQVVTIPAVALTPLPGTISGTIVDRGNGDQPLAGAVVTEASGLHATTTGADGRFELTGLAQGFTYVVVRKAGYRAEATGAIDVTGDSTTEIGLGLSPNWEGDLPGHIEGVVRDADGSPVPGAVVSVVGDPGLAASTGSDGRYVLVVPSAAAWVLEAGKQGYSRALSQYIFASAGDRPYHVAVDFALPAANSAGTLEIRTFDPVSRNLFRGDVWFRTPLGLWHAPVPDSGLRTVTGVPAGLVRDCFGERVLPAGGTLTIRCMGEPVVPLGSPRWAVGGFVLNRYTWEPVPGAMVSFVNGSTAYPVFTDGNGIFSRVSGPTGDWSAVVSAAGFLDTSPWTFTAEDNQESGAFYGAIFMPEMPLGSLYLAAPVEGAVLTTPNVPITVTLAPGRTNDQLLWVHPWLSTGNVSTITTTYAPDGSGATLIVGAAIPNGPLTIGVEAVTQTGAPLSIQRNVTVAFPSHPSDLDLSPSVVGSGTVVTASVTVDPPAPAGGLTVAVSSSSPSVVVPATISLTEGESAKSFEVVAGSVSSLTVVTVTASTGPFSAVASLTVNPTVPPPVLTELSEGSLSGWQAFADPPYVASVALDSSRVKEGTASLRFTTDSGFDCGVRYVVPGGAHWDLRSVRFLTFWSYGSGTEPYQGEQPVIVLRGPGGSIRYQPPVVQTVNGEWRFHRVPIGDASDWIVSTEGEPSLGDVTSFEIHQDTWGMGLTVYYDGVEFTSEVPEDLAEGTAALWGTFASDGATTSVVNDSSTIRSGESALRFDTASGFDTGLVFPKSGSSRWNLSDVRSLSFWIRAENPNAFQGNQPVVVLRSPSGSIWLEPGEGLLGAYGWRFFEVPIDGTFPWTRTQSGTPDLSDVEAIEIHTDTWGYGFRLYVDGVSVGRPLPLLVLPASSAPAGGAVTATVLLSEAAPAGGRTVQLSSSDPFVASVPVSVVVPQGSKSATFPVTAGPVTIGTAVTLTATDRGFSAKASLRVDPVADVTSLTLGASTVIGGLTVSASVTIGAPAWAGGTAVFLTSSNPAAASVPSAVIVPAGSTTATFSVTTGAVASDTPVTLSANAGATMATASLVVTPAPILELASVSAAPGYVSAGGTLTVTVTMTAPAPPGGRSITLSSSAPELLSVPASVLVPAGTMQATATATAPPTAGEGSVTVTAAEGPIQKTTTVSVIPLARIAGLSFAASGGFPGESVTGSLTLTAAAPAAGYTVPLVSSLPGDVSVPANVVVPAGSLTTTFQATIAASGPGGVATISASQHGVTKTATVAAITFTDLTVSPNPVLRGATVQLRAILSSAVPAGRTADLALSSSAPDLVSVPPSAQVAAGSDVRYFSLPRAEVTADTSVDITVTSLGVTRTVRVVLESLKITGFSTVSGRVTVAACSSETLRITTNAPAPAGGAMIEIQRENRYPGGETPVPGSTPTIVHFLLLGGQSTVDVPTTADWTPEPLQLVSTARLGSSQLVHSMAIQPGTVSVTATPSTAPRGSTIRIRLGTSGGSYCNGGVTFDAPVSSNNPAVLQVPATLQFIVLNTSGHGGSLDWYLDLPVSATAASGVARLTFSAFGTSASVDVTVPEAAIAGLTINPSAAPFGSPAAGLVSLDAPAPAGGVALVFESSDPAKATVPASLEVPAGTSSAGFVVTPMETTTAADVVVTATFGGGSRTAPFRALPASVATVIGRVVDSSDYDVEGPVEGATTTLSPGFGQFVTAADGLFRLHPNPGNSAVRVQAPGFVPFTSASLDLAASQAMDLGTIRARRAGGGACTLGGQVFDPQGQPIDGAEGVLEGFDVAVRTDGAGRYSVSLPYQHERYRMTFSKPGYQAWIEDVTPYIAFAPWDCPGGFLRDFILDPNPRPAVSRGTFQKPSMLSGRTAKLEIVLTGPAPSYGAKVSVTRVKGNGYVGGFDQVVIPGGHDGYLLATDIYLPEVTELTTVQYVLFYGGVRKTTSIDVAPETVQINCPWQVVGGTTTSCTLYLLTGAAPVGGALVQVSADVPALLSVPTSVTVPQGQTSVTLPVTASQLRDAYKSVTLKGSWAGGWGERGVTVYRPDVETVAVSPTGLIGGGNATGTVTLKGPAYPAGQTTVSLQSSIAEIVVPATVTIAPGESTATFPITTSSVTQPKSGTISGQLTMLAGGAISGASPKGTYLLLTTSGLGLVCTPSELYGGWEASCQVSLPGSPAPAGGAVVTLTCPSGRFTVPASVSVPERSYSQTFTVRAKPVASTTSGVIRAEYGTAVAEATLTIREPYLRRVDFISGQTTEGGLQATASVSFDGNAPAGGIVVALSSSDPAASVPASVVVPEGDYSSSFPVATSPVAAATDVVITATYGARSVTVTQTVEPQTWRLSGLAPGRALAGAEGIVLYGRSFLPGDGVRIAGPVFSATAPETPLCDEGAGACPAFDVTGLISQPYGIEGDRVTFTAPASLAPGYYAIRARGAAGTLSVDARWLLVEDPAPTFAVLPPEQHGMARPITSGQTVSGTFAENGDTSGATNDFNLYYFVAAAGSRVSLRLERADTSLPWEHPDSLDPQLSLIAPDGFVYENLFRQDVAPTTDLNAELTDVVLGQTGMWLIAASTSRGHGGYRLTYSMTPPGSVPHDKRVLAFSGRGTTAPVGSTARLTLAALDPRGYPVSGASVSYIVSYPDPMAGTVQWPGGTSTFTAVDGLAQRTVKATSPGAVDIRPHLTDINGILTSYSIDAASDALIQTAVDGLPRYQPIEHHVYTVRDVDPDGNVTLDLGPVKTFKPARPSRVKTEWKTGTGSTKALDARPAPAPEPEASPEPRTLPPVETSVASSCNELNLFRFQAVDASDVKFPFTVTLSDVSPGKPPEGAPIGEKGIEGYRIEKTVNLKIDVKDRDGNEPQHPVLLRLTVAGPASRTGMLIVGPASAPKECKEAWVVWHARDAQGTLIRNDLIDYRLGTLSLLPGVEPDPDHPGQVKPVWGVAELLDVTAEVITTDSTVISQKAFAVRPLPGKPQKLVDWDGTPQDDGWEWWNGFYTYHDPSLGRRAVSLTSYNAYTLVDKYDNTVWGYRDTVTRNVPSQMTAGLPYQETSGPDFRAYALQLKWWADAADQMPQGTFPIQLVVPYAANEPDWTAGEVLATTLLTLQGGNQTHLKFYERYEARFGLDDGDFPMSVSPEASKEALPKVGPPAIGAVPGRSFDSPRRLALVLVTGKESPSAEEVFRAPHHPWEWQGTGWVERPVVSAPDPKIDVSSKPRLKLRLVNVHGEVQTTAAFKVHLCPRFDHEGSPYGPEWACPTEPVASVNGVINVLPMNPGIVGSGDPPSPDATGYLGLELTQAPVAPGTYYVYVESLDRDVKIRDQSLLHLDDTPEGQYQGGFALCTVQGAEFLDANFQRIEPLSVVGPTNAYVRFTDPGEAGGSILVDVNSYDGESELDTAPDVSLTRVGRSGTFLSEPIELNPPWTADDPALRMTLAARPKKIRVNPWKAEKVEAIRRHPTTSIARSKTVGPGGVFRFPVGLKLPLTLYRSLTFYSRQARYDLCSPQGGPPCGADIIDPTSVAWRVEPIGVDGEGDTQIARMEVERGTNPPQEFVRGIRISTGKAWVPGGVITVSALAGLQKVASAPVQVARPDSLGTYADITRDYEGTPVDLKKLIIDTADQYGIPPHYLAAQMYAESYPIFNPYTYRYEATSRDFKQLVGDWSETVTAGARRLLQSSTAFPRLGVRSGGTAEVLPCQTAPAHSLNQGTPCIPGQEPPAIETFTFTADGTSTSYPIGGLGGDKIQLGVDVRRPDALLPDFTQNVLADCVNDVLVFSTFCVDGDAGALRFGLPPVGQQVVSFRRVKVLRDLPVPADFGSLIGGAAQQQAAIDKIRLKNPSANVRPPASLNTTIRQWAIQRGANALASNSLERWGDTFWDSDLFTLIKRDPSFEVQGQWFGAASYGLLQVLPDDVRANLENRAVFSAADAQFLRTTYYDPMTQNPLERLFDPANCVPLGAAIDVTALVISEDQDPDPTCTHKRNECTWRNIWSRRFCRFNTGGQGPCMYGNKIVFGADAKPPLVDMFVPRLNP